MNKFRYMLQEMNRKLSDSMGENLDHNNMINTATDLEIEEMAEEYALTHSAPNTTALYELH